MVENHIYRKEGGGYVKGVIFKVLLHDTEYYLVDLKVFADGIIDCVGQEIDLEQLKHYLGTGKLTRNLPVGKRIFVPYVGYIYSSSNIFPDDNEHLIGLIESAVELLNENEEEVYLDECILTFRDYLVKPTEENFQKLEKVYQRIPEEEKAVFEPIRKNDPLVKLMTKKQPFTSEERAYMLNDYFEGEYLEMK
ncbi:hypothetical protein BKI52_23740 [marine bacterium AO1-C]|nr:hypothetical protein BKI52_23740 [marine bacterium AO1-C]